MKKILRFFLILIALLLLAVFLLPVIFKDQIFELVREESKNQIKGELVIQDMSLSLIRNFPNLSLGLEGFKIIGEGDFEDMSLVESEEIVVEIDLFSAIKGSELTIESISVLNADVYALILNDGEANFDITADSDSTLEDASDINEESSAFSLQLNEFKLENVNIVFDDRQNDMYAKIDHLNHTLSGKFSEVNMALKAFSEIEELEVVMGGTSMLRKTHVESNMDVNYDMESGKLTLGENFLALNGLKINASGVVILGDFIEMDLSFNAPNSTFSELLSLIPEVYYNDFSSVETQGQFELHGFVKGEMNDSDVLPAFGLTVKVHDASFKYPDLPAGAEQLNLSLAIEKPIGTADATQIDLHEMKGLLAGQPFEGRLNLKHPVSDPDIDFYLKANLDLEKVGKLVPQEELSYRGILETDLSVKGKMSDFENQNIQKVEASGHVLLQSFYAKTSSFGLPIELDTLALQWNPNNVRVPVMKGTMGTSDFSGSGSIDNLLSYALSDTTLRGRFHFTSSHFDLNELAASVPESGEENVDSTTTSPMEVVRIPYNLDMDIRTELAEVLYDDLVLQNVQGQLVLVDGIASLVGFKMNTLGGIIGMDGTYDSNPVQPEVLFDLTLENFGVSDAAKHFNMIEKLAPIIETATGKFSTSFNMSSLLGEDMTPDLTSLSAKGWLSTENVKVEPDVLKTVAQKLNNDQLSRIVVGNSRVSYSIENGTLKVNPFQVKMGNYDVTIAGQNGLDQSLAYSMKTKVPMDAIQIPQEVKALGISGDIDLKIDITGTITEPQVHFDYGTITQGIQAQVQQVIQQGIDSLKNEASQRIKAEAEKIRAQARAEADKLLAEAKVQADRIRQEARNLSNQIVAEANRQADKLISEAGSNPLKRAAAETAANQIKREAQSRANQGVQEADRTAQRLYNEAETRANSILSDANERAQKLTDNA